MNNIQKNRSQISLNIKKQQGWTMWGLIFTASFVAFSGYIGLQLFPVYTTNNSVKNSMQLAIESLDKSKVTKASVKRLIDNQLYLDGAHDLLDYNNDLEIKRSQRELIIQVNYERKVDLFFNLSLVATFENEVKRDL